MFYRHTCTDIGLSLHIISKFLPKSAEYKPSFYMPMRKEFPMKIKLPLLFFYLSLLLSACAPGSSPRLIASHESDSIPIAIQPIVPEPGYDPMVVYNLRLDLEVSNVDRATEDAMDLASQYGGYLASSNSWIQDGEKRTTLVLAVPIRNYEQIRRQLLKLGNLLAEQVYGELIPSHDYNWETYSYITVNLHPSSFSWPSLSFPDWRPARTFQRAWGVFTAIFGLIVDIAIWFVVVLGPFVLIAFGIRALIRWRGKDS
jgi:hypothetical protein